MATKPCKQKNGSLGVQFSHEDYPDSLFPCVSFDKRNATSESIATGSAIKQGEAIIERETNFLKEQIMRERLRRKMERDLLDENEEDPLLTEEENEDDSDQP